MTQVKAAEFLYFFFSYSAFQLRNERGKKRKKKKEKKRSLVRMRLSGAVQAGAALPNVVNKFRLLIKSYNTTENRYKFRAT